MCGGAAISWVSTAQERVALSTPDTEYVALSETRKQALLMRIVWAFVFVSGQRFIGNDVV